MKDKIKEIREYIACPQFGDDHYGKWGALRLDQRQKIKDLLDYIINLQEEKKIPEKINTFEELTRIPANFEFNDILLADKINEIIDYLKSKGE